MTAVPGALIVRFFLLAGTLAAYTDNKSNAGKATLIGSVGEGRGLWGMAIAP